MLSELSIEEVILDQKKYLLEHNTGVPRQIDIQRLINTNQIVVITGVRRCGKSTLLHQIARNYENYYYINFDDERLLNFEVSDFQKMMLIFKKKYQSNVIFIDEIQNVELWERFVRRIFDEGYKIYITGSNAKLLSSDLSTHLTGRYIKIELFPFPFSFTEFLKFENVEYPEYNSDVKSKILNAFDKYLLLGGFPDYLKNQDFQYLQNIYNDILYKDLIVRFGIKNSSNFKTLAHYLFTNFTKEISYNSLKNILNISNVNTIKDYVNYLQQAYLCFECYKFDYSLKSQITYNKKIYCIDNGLRKSISFNFSSNLGHYLENLIYLVLRYKNEDVYFYKTKQNYEIDFLIQKDEIYLYQVAYNMSEQKTLEREIRSLTEAMSELNSKNATILTHNHSETIENNGIVINILPVWKWLIEN